MKSKEIPLTSMSYRKSRPLLPANFAMKIIEKEIELEKSWSQNVINELVELYSQAIEYYNYNNDPKFYDYQDRMHKMLLKPQVMSAISHSSHSRVKSEPAKNSADDHKLELEKSRKLMAAELHSTLSITTHKAERSITRTIDQHENETKDLLDLLTDNFRQQDTDLMSRLENRRKLNRTFHADTSFTEQRLNISYGNAGDIIESDRSGGFLIDRNEMNKKIEEIMERNFAEKSAKIAEISVKYEKEIIEMQDDGVMALVITQMRQNMKEEIEAISKEYDEKRKAEVSRIKQEYVC